MQVKMSFMVFGNLFIWLSKSFGKFFEIFLKGVCVNPSYSSDNLGVFIYNFILYIVIYIYCYAIK